ncbi:NUDIX hydrolase [Oscillospiraceae bacterium HV4-5-C5C]|nr:NUDIX hydrolase [Oscillospiraceae bacterium HV4-5-C5C]
MSDILFNHDPYVFSYRVAGILLHGNKILLQKPTNDTGYAIPGGHVEFGETSTDALIREFKEEINADITIGDLKWVAEIFFPWGGKPCHQICLYYKIALKDQSQIPLDGVFIGDERIQGRDFKLAFHWIPIDSLNQVEVYPTNIAELMTRHSESVQHFIYLESE